MQAIQMEVLQALKEALEERSLEEQNALATGNVAATSTGGKKPKKNDLWANPTLEEQALGKQTDGQPIVVKIKCEKKLDPKSIEVIKDFIRFCQGKLHIDKFPHFYFHSTKKPNMTTGCYMMDDNTLHVLVGHRLIMDVLRTIAHELTHRKQHETGLLDQELAKQDPLDEMGDLNTVYENEAYEKSGNFVKEFARRTSHRDYIYSLYEESSNKRNK